MGAKLRNKKPIDAPARKALGELEAERGGAIAGIAIAFMAGVCSDL